MFYRVLRLLLLLQSVSCLDEKCQWTHTDELACKGLKSNDLSKEIGDQIQKQSIVLLNITKSNIPYLSADSVKEFGELFELDITESQICEIKNDTFKNNPKLTNLNFSNNYLETFTSAAFASPNKVIKIDLSSNLLTNLSNFNTTQFPRLTLFILDDNELTHLPKELIDKIREENEFYLSVEKNPWDCSHPNWKAFLDDQLSAYFCGGEKYEYVPKSKPNQRDKRMNQSKFENESLGVSLTIPSDTKRNLSKYKITELDGQLRRNETASMDTQSYFNCINQSYFENKNPDENLTLPYFDVKRNVSKFDIEELGEKPKGNVTAPTDAQSCFNCSFYFCLFWFVAGIWIGIILGNIFKIKTLLFSGPKKMYSENLVI